MLIKSLAIFFLSLSLNLLLIRFLIYLAWKYKFIKKHENFFGRAISIPNLGGLGIYLIFLAVIFLNRSFFPLKILPGIFISGSLMLIIGFLDDRMDFPPLIKIAFQFLAVLVLLFFGIKTEIVYFSRFFNLVITILWILGITNALNLLDIMDGLCGGLSFIIALTFFVLALIGNNIFVAVMAVGLAGSVLAFSKYNFPPAKIFLGNSGSLFLGFIFSIMAILLKYAPEGKNIALFTPVVILGLPFYDTFFVVLMRLFKKKSVFLKTKDHLAMRFFNSGYSEKGTLFRMYALTLGLSLGAVLISLSSDLIGLIVIGILMIGLGMLTWKMAGIKVK